MAAHAMGKTVAELIVARDALADWLAGKGGGPDFWPGYDVIAPAREYPARHPSIRLCFEAIAEAAAIASEQDRSEEHTSELQSLMRISYAVFCLKKKKNNIDLTQMYICNL